MIWFLFPCFFCGDCACCYLFLVCLVKLISLYDRRPWFVLHLRTCSPLHHSLTNLYYFCTLLNSYKLVSVLHTLYLSMYSRDPLRRLFRISLNINITLHANFNILNATFFKYPLFRTILNYWILSTLARYLLTGLI